jgi:hypothetical protein
MTVFPAPGPPITKITLCSGNPPPISASKPRIPVLTFPDNPFHQTTLGFLSLFIYYVSLFGYHFSFEKLIFSGGVHLRGIPDRSSCLSSGISRVSFRPVSRVSLSLHRRAQGLHKAPLKGESSDLSLPKL